jgi:hypothetical protein
MSVGLYDPNWELALRHMDRRHDEEVAPRQRRIDELEGEIGRLKSQAHDLEAEVMKVGGELVMEVGRRMQAERRSVPPWTKDRPTVPGWYWCRDDYGCNVVEIDGSLRAHFQAMVWPGIPDDWEWSGPLPSPPEPA